MKKGNYEVFSVSIPTPNEVDDYIDRSTRSRQRRGNQRIVTWRRLISSDECLPATITDMLSAEETPQVGAKFLLTFAEVKD